MFIKLQACRFKLLDIGMYPINLEKSKMHSMYMSVPKYFRTIRYPDYHYILDAKIHNHHYNILRHQIFKRKKYANIARQQEIKDKQHEPDYKPRYAVWYDKQYRLWQDTDEDFMPKFLLDGWVIPVYDKSDHSVDINNHQHYINGNPTGYVIVEGISSIIDHSWWNMKTIGFVKARVLPVHAII